MGRKPRNGADAEHTEELPEQDGSNCTDETRRQFYREALIAKIGVESAAATVKAKTGEYRNVLKAAKKAAKKAGVDPDAIARTLKLRFQDEEELVIQVREELKMLDLAGVIPNIKDKLLARLDVQELTASEQAQISLDRAYDAGVFDGRSGAMRHANPFTPGTDLYDTWDRGWLVGQTAIAAEMMPDPPAAVQ